MLLPPIFGVSYAQYYVLRILSWINDKCICVFGKTGPNWNVLYLYRNSISTRNAKEHFIRNIECQILFAKNIKPSLVITRSFNTSRSFIFQVRIENGIRW